MGRASPSAGREKIERGVSRGEILVETCWVTEQPGAHMLSIRYETRTPRGLLLGRAISHLK